jgi:hypothetical protein
MYVFQIYTQISNSLEVTPYILAEVSIDSSEKYANSKNHVNWFLGVLEAADSYETSFISIP